MDMSDETGTDSDASERVDYDEFGLFHENIAEFGLEVSAVPPVERVDVELSHDPGRRVSALKWTDAPVEVVFVHGGAQNAHTWDTVVLALGRRALAVDLPGHGHSDWRADGAYTPRNLADDVAAAIGSFADGPVLVVGMSLGGLTSMELAVRHPQLVAGLVLVDITPGVNREKAKAVIDFVDGPQSFASFDDLLRRTMEFNPTRSESSLRRGILHNAHQLADGSWQWRYDRSSHVRSRELVEGGPDDATANGASLWDDFGAVNVPITLVRGAESPVVDADDVAEARRRQPGLRVEVVDGAGHSVQGDRPIELAGLVGELLGDRPQR